MAPLSFKVIYRDNYHIMINLVCNNRDRQYIKYFISHITTYHQKFVTGEAFPTDMVTVYILAKNCVQAYISIPY